VFEESQLMDLDLLAQTDPRRAQQIRDALRSDACWIATQDEAVLGYAIRGEFFDHDFLQLLYVAAAHRRRGVGRALVDALERARRSDCLFTSTNTSNAAMRELLVRRGYIASGVVHNLTPDDPELIFMKRIESSGLSA
jgi:GNAT superfamily N-acetyltransferase